MVGKIGKVQIKNVFNSSKLFLKYTFRLRVGDAIRFRRVDPAGAAAAMDDREDLVSQAKLVEQAER